MSEKAPAITPVLRYGDALAAIDFLERAFGFKRVMVHEEGGRVVHAELAFDDAMIMVSSDGDEPYGRHAGWGWTYVAVPDADAHYDRAKAAGAEIIREIEDQDYGSRDYSSRDPEGNIWSFGTYRPEREWTVGP
jgi:uncharacterized glyoxalase superfamily protein PhnB